jgi:hypothetical protein
VLAAPPEQGQIGQAAHGSRQALGTPSVRREMSAMAQRPGIARFLQRFGRGNPFFRGFFGQGNRRFF